MTECNKIGEGGKGPILQKTHKDQYVFLTNRQTAYFSKKFVHKQSFAIFGRHEFLDVFYGQVWVEFDRGGQGVQETAVLWNAHASMKEISVADLLGYARVSTQGQDLEYQRTSTVTRG